MHRSKVALSFLATLVVVLAAGQSYAQTFTTLTSFNGTNGFNPFGSLTPNANGSILYGTTEAGENVFSLPVTGGTPTTLGTFNGTTGFAPFAGLTPSADWTTLYGTAQEGGASPSPGYGTVFSIPVAGGTPTALASFNGTDGSIPLGDLTLVGSNLYGMTADGGIGFTGNNGTGDGVIFSVPATGGTPTVLASFNGTDGEAPRGDLTLIGSTFYGMTLNTIFSIPVTGGTPTVLAYGVGGNGSLTLIGSTFYGMSTYGGANGDGEIFSIPVTGGTPTILATFDGTNGEYPHGSLTLVGSTLYGTTSFGGNLSLNDGLGDGTIFSIPVAGGPINTLVTFDGTNGVWPYASLTLIGSTLYGTTAAGGLGYNGGTGSGAGTVFALTTPEPSSLASLGLGGIGLGVLALRRKIRRQAA